MPPETKSEQVVSRGGATPSEAAFSGVSLAQSYKALDAFGRAVADPRIAARTIGGDIAQKSKELEDAKTAVDVAQYYVNQGGTWWGGLEARNERLKTAKQKVGDLTGTLR